MLLQALNSKYWMYGNLCQITFKTTNQTVIFSPVINVIHSLLKVKYGEENGNFRKTLRIWKAEICCRGKWKYANMFCKNLSRPGVEKYAKKAVV